MKRSLVTKTSPIYILKEKKKKKALGIKRAFNGKQYCAVKYNPSQEEKRREEHRLHALFKTCLKSVNNNYFPQHGGDVFHGITTRRFS